MKIRKIFLSFLFIFLLGNVSGMAAEIPKDLLRKAAQNFYTANRMERQPKGIVDSRIMAEYTMRKESVAVCQIFNFIEGGWVILSADDRFQPVLAYSLTGTIDPNEGSPEMKWWLDQYAVQILEAINQNISAKSETAQSWNDLLNATFRISNKGAKNIQPLLTSTWDQGSHYNYYCPLDAGGPGGRVWAGCVATSISQVMYYYRYPMHGTGTHGYNSDYGYLEADFGNTTYDWNSMQDNINGICNFPMALLQYHCGIAVNMMYSPQGSGAYMDDATQALIQYFGYSPSANLKYKSSYSDTDWQNLLIAELDARHPLSYAGFGSGGGHAFVCDGYDGTGMFHFNWGWSGSGDGYFYLDNLNPGSSFSNGQQAIFNLVPASAYPYGCSGMTTLTTTLGSFEDGSGPAANYGSNQDCYWLIHPADSVQSIRLSFSRFSTENTNDIVTVYDGPTTSDSVLGVFSGANLPPELASSGDQLLVRFTTNGSVEDAGWSASFKTVLYSYCPAMTIYSAPSGTIGDGSGPADYHNNSLCRWRIAPPGATGITINFTSFNLEGRDLLGIFDEVSNTQIESFQGSDLPPYVFVFSPKVMLVFMSDAVGTASGFEGTYTSSNTGINDNEGSSTMMAFPNPSGDRLHFSATGVSGPAELTLTSPTGAEMMHVSGLPANGEFHHDLDVSAFAPGLYFLVFEHDGQRAVQRISVIRTK